MLISLLLDSLFIVKEVAHWFIGDVAKLYSFPHSIGLDRDQMFLSLFWLELFRKAGTKFRYSIA